MEKTGRVWAPASGATPASRGRSRRKAERDEGSPRRRDADAGGPEDERNREGVPEGLPEKPDAEVEEVGAESGRRGHRRPLMTERGEGR